MKVTPPIQPPTTGLNESQGAGKAAQKTGVGPGSNTAASVKGSRQDLDSVAISDNALLMRQARETAQNAPDVRSERVADLKRQIQQGTYQVDNQAVADRLVDEHFSASLGKNNL